MEQHLPTDRIEFQRDLFEESSKPDRRRKVVKQEPIARGYRLHLNISYEQIVFFVIALIMVLVLTFSLGAERGKRLASPKAPESPTLAEFEVVAEKPETAATPERIVREIEAPETEIELSTPARPEVARTIKPVLPNIAEEPSKPYTIQVATYWSKNSAKKELESLRKKGFDSFIISTGGKYEICVGSYISKATAEKDMEKLKKRYKDRFLRRR